MIKIKEWVQREWDRPGREFYHTKGDFLSITSFMPAPHRQSLQRAPSWYGFLPYAAGFNRLAGGFYNDTNNAFVLIGQQTSDDHLASSYLIFPQTYGPFELLAQPISLGGAHKQNVHWWNRTLYLIANDNNVYAGSDYTATLTQFYSGNDAKILLPVGDQMFLFTTSGDILKLNSTATAFEAFYTALTYLDVIYALAYHGYIMLFTRSSTGGHYIHRLTPHNATLNQLTAMPYATGQYTTYNSMFALHDDKVYFYPGDYTAADWVTKLVDIYSFNGASIQHVDRIGPITTGPNAMGLIEWRGNLLFYHLADSHQEFNILIGDSFTDFAPHSATLLPGADAYSAADELGMPVQYMTYEGLTYLIGSGNSVLTTARVDLDHPGIKKNIINLTATISAALENFNVIIEYRTDDQTEWTTAVTADNTQLILSPQLNLECYHIQMRVTFSDLTGTTPDIRLEAISIVYSIGI